MKSKTKVDNKGENPIFKTAKETNEAYETVGKKAGPLSRFFKVCG